MDAIAELVTTLRAQAENLGHNLDPVKSSESGSTGDLNTSLQSLEVMDYLRTVASVLDQELCLAGPAALMPYLPAVEVYIDIENAIIFIDKVLTLVLPLVLSLVHPFLPLVVPFFSMVVPFLSMVLPSFTWSFHSSSWSFPSFSWSFPSFSTFPWPSP